MKRKEVIFIGIIIVLFGLYFWITKRDKNAIYQPITSFNKIEQGYAGSQSCKECHASIFSEWKTSDHFKAMQIPTEQSVLGNFNNAVYSADGITSRFFKKNGKFFINTQGNDGKYADFEVVYTFGHYPLQQYLIAFDKGKLQVTRQSWDSRTNKWFHQYKEQKIPHDDWLHWTGNSQNWNLMCAYCHSVNVQKNYNPHTDSYQTTFNEISVGCESCHGQGKRHNAVMKSTEYQKGLAKELFIKTGKESSQTQELNTCFPCHARRGEVTQHHFSSEEIMDNFIPELPVTPNYFADGQALEEVYKFASFLQSKMYHAGVKCSNCHNPHSGKLKLPADKLCLQCHSPSYATSSHTFHKENTAGSDCRSCHMPTRTYMGNDVRHDHNFAVPRPDLSEKYGVPNACNQCHSDKSAKWAKNAVEKWYGKERKPHFAEDLILGSKQNEKSFSHLKKLLIQKQTPQIIKASAVHYLGGIYTTESFELIKNQLKSSDAQTRYQAIMALMNFSIENYVSEIIPVLNDKVRAVRMVTANLLLTQLGIEEAQKISGFNKALKEFEEFILSQSDFAVGSASAGDFYAKLGDNSKAILFYSRALKRDKTLNYVRLNLATIYNQNNDNQKALAILNDAQKLEPKNAQIQYFLGLLHSELSNYEQAKKAFDNALKLGMNDQRLLRNYQLLLQKINESK